MKLLKDYFSRRKLFQFSMTGEGGFTLVEMLVAVAIFFVMMATVMVVLTTTRVAYFNAEARITAQENLRKALGSMFREMSESSPSRIDIPEPAEIVFQIPVIPNSGTYSGQSVDNKNNILYGSRAIPSTDPAGEENQSIQYILVPNNDQAETNRLVRRVLDGFPNGTQVGADMVIANYIDSIEFCHVGFPANYNDGMSTNAIVCHVPDGVVANSRTLVVPRADVGTHTGHGDAVGPCAGDAVAASADNTLLNIVVCSRKTSKTGREMRYQSKFCIALRN